MNLEKLIEAETEARKFLKKCKIARERARGDDYFFMTGCRESASLKRQSMELTNALADLRKSS